MNERRQEGKPVFSCGHCKHALAHGWPTCSNCGINHAEWAALQDKNNAAPWPTAFIFNSNYELQSRTGFSGWFIDWVFGKESVKVRNVPEYTVVYPDGRVMKSTDGIIWVFDKEK